MKHTFLAAIAFCPALPQLAARHTLGGIIWDPASPASKILFQHG